MSPATRRELRGAVPDRALLPLSAAVLGALGLVVALGTPWTPTVPIGDPAAGLTAAQVRTAEDLRATLLGLRVTSTVAVLAVGGLLVLSRSGRRAATALQAAVPGPGWCGAAVVTATLLLVLEVVRLPFSAQAERVLVAAGLSTRSWAGWARDQAVQTALTTTLTVVAVLVLLALARLVPRWWPAVGAVAAAGLVVVLSVVHPVVVEPAFNDFEPLPPGTLRTDVLALAEAAGLDVQEVLVSDTSRRTTALNAYVSGIGPTRRVVLDDTLVQAMTDEQVLTVLAHELGHVAGADARRDTVTGALAAAAGILLLGVLLGLPRVARTWRGRPERFVALVVLAVLLLPIAAVPVQSLLSRQVERRADVYALDMLGSGQAYASAMRLLAERNLSDPSPPVWVHRWYGTHPTTAERVSRATSPTQP